MTRLRLLLALTALTLLAPATAHAAPEPGMNLALPFTAADLQNVKDSGAKTARFFMFTTNTPGQFDGPVAELAAIGVKPVFVVAGDPANPPTSPPAIAQYTAFIAQAAAHFKGRVAGWEILLNRAGTTFRALPEEVKEGLTETKAIALMLEQPSMIKRPVLDVAGRLIVGFKPETYAAALG